ncbi:carotenoid biosynthesis protein [Massilia luteola]|uniref:carotenoid biosynthesis protein n=1 Tax=Massilia luteola TaxID=3081751 RepID=UPI002ACC080B|nr:carotenoid biosynthesis protein [Massilia sp. Gc5]
MPPSLHRRLPLVSATLLALFLLVLARRIGGESTMLLVASSLVMFACCWASAAHLLGARAALRLVAIAMSFGWLAEQLGSSYGWFFGSYTYTPVLGPRLGDVPVVIPMMWFALAYIGYVVSNLIVWQDPVDAPASLGHDAILALVGATVVTCYDLGVDPYMVYVLKAWIMAKTDGWWFGETVQGFAGWMTVSFAILFAFRRLARVRPAAAVPPTARHVLVPLGVYAGLMVFQVLLGYPVEARTIALFAMGFPLLAAGAGLLRWQGVLARPAAGVQPAAALPAVALKEAA